MSSLVNRRLSRLEQEWAARLPAASAWEPPPVPEYTLRARTYDLLERHFETGDGRACWRAAAVLRAVSPRAADWVGAEVWRWRLHTLHCDDPACAHHARAADPAQTAQAAALVAELLALADRED